MPLGFYFDNTRCTGCRTCEIACMDYRGLTVGRRFRRVIDYEGGSTREEPDGTVSSTAYAYHVSLACNHCSAPACVEVCPTGAMHSDELGLVGVDAHRCIGCGYCTIACPYHAPSIDPQLRRSTKCDGCGERVRAGLRPICVEACPLRALDFGDTDELAGAHPDCVAQVMPLPDPALTRPNLLILPSEAALLADREGADERGTVTNYDEVVNNGRG